MTTTEEDIVVQAPVLNEQKAIDVIKAWLEEKHCTLWQTFDVSDDEGRTRAATWLHGTIESVLAFEEQYRS